VSIVRRTSGGRKNGALRVSSVRRNSGGRKNVRRTQKTSGGRKNVRRTQNRPSGGRKNVRRTQKCPSGGRPADAKTSGGRKNARPADAYSGGRKFQRTQNPADRVHRAECGHPVEVGRRSTRCRIGMLLGYLCRVHGEIQWKHLVERHQTALEKWKLGKVYIQGPSRDETCTELYVGSASTLNAIN
jgi:hypothetical protein